MYFILAKHHGKEKVYAFKASKELLPYIEKGTVVLVETNKGPSIAVCQSASFSGEGAFDVVKLLGAYMPLKPVLGIVNDAVYDYVARDLSSRSRVVVNSAYLVVEEKKDETGPVY